MLWMDSYSQFVEQTSKLSEMDTYPQLQQRTSGIGLRVDSVVYRGYHASEQMQVGGAGRGWVVDGGWRWIKTDG